jgi:hypothetical protein
LSFRSLHADSLNTVDRPPSRTRKRKRRR